MATQKDFQLVQYLLERTNSRAVSWEATAENDQYVASFKGKYNVLVDKGTRNNSNYYWLTLRDKDEREMLKLYDSDVDLIRPLYEQAERNSLNVDEAIDEILDDDIPF